MKRLLLAFAGLSVIGATAQEARVDRGRSADMYVASHLDGTPYNTSANKYTGTLIGTAPNVYGTGFGPKTNIWADEDLNTIVFLHRSDYSSNGDNSSGSLRFDYSTDGGANWTANAGPVYNPNLSGYAYPGFARYPHIGILNESGNTNPLNASISVWAPTLAGTNAASWGGALMGTHKMDNTTTNMSVDTTGGHLTLENSYVDGGTFWGLSFDHPDYLNTEYTDTALVWKGTMDWTNDSMTFTETKAYLPSSFVVFDDGTSGKIYGDGHIFFASNMTTGYISVEAYDSTIAPGRVIHPYLIKTTDGGSSWGAPMGPNLDELVDNGSGDSLVDIFDMMTGGWDIGHLTSSTRGHDMAVDMNGNPHMFVHVFPGTGTTPTGGSTAGEFTYFPAVNLLVDVFTTDGGLTWECNIISQVFTFSFDFDAINGPVPEATRPYISMNEDRNMMFFSWFETDTTFASGTDNEFPDWRCQGYNVTGDSLEGQMTVMGTYGDATWGNVADWAFDNGDGTHQLHMTYGPIEDFSSFSVLNPIDFYYLGQPYPNSLGLEEIELNNFSVSQNYPNPTEALTKIAIEAAAPAQFNLSIVDLTGRLILNEDLGLLNEGRHIHTVDATNFASGVYFYTVESGDYSITKKLIVE